MLFRSLLLATFLCCLTQVVFADSSNFSEGAHQAVFERNQYPSAKECATCHVEHYREWSVSPHAYAQLSPVFNAMHRTLLKQTNGTLGDFCIRCHTPVGMDKGEAASLSNLERDPVSLEGVTCITCHRRKTPLGKVSGRINIRHGDIFSYVYGSLGGKELKRVLEEAEYKVNSERGKTGRNIHAGAEKFDQITTSAFCGTCHDVNGFNGFRLEEAFSEYKSSPAAKRGTSCQDCHMGQEPGVPAGYAHRPVALVGGKPTKPRKRTNHMFVGPDYSIVHPGIFPHNVTASEFATLEEWLEFDYKAGWGTDDFEDTVLDESGFPERWKSAVDRYEARDIIGENLSLLEEVAQERKKLLQRGYQLGEVRFKKTDTSEIVFEVEFKNGTDGHNVPTGFDGERVVFLRVKLTDASGKTVFQSGDLDPNGDLRDSHSLYVHDGKLPLDPYLFSLQSRFIINMIRGGDREQVLTTNYSASPLPFLRPPTNATSLIGRPLGGRKHRQTVPPLASRWATYRVGPQQLRNSQAPYKLKVQILAGMVPVNLVHAIQGVGFDYSMSPREVADAIVAGHQVLWEKELVLEASAKDK